MARPQAPLRPDYSLFVPNIAAGGFATDLAGTTEATILTNIDKILPKPLYLKSKKVNASSATDESMVATATLTVSE